MADGLQVEIRGLSELSRALNEMPAQLSTRIMREALHAAGDVIKAEAETTAPVRTGELREDILVEVHVSGDLSRNRMRVGPGYDRRGLKRLKRSGRLDTTSSPGVYGKFLEFGTKHMAPRPWLRPAYELSKSNAVAAFVQVVRAGVETVARTLNRGH